MTEQAPNVLILKGRLQLETARIALTYSGVNPAAEAELQTYVSDIYETMPDNGPVEIYLHGDEVAAEKRDILRSLNMLSADKRIPWSTRLACDALKEIL